MKLWKRTTGALKDRYCIFVAKFSPHGPFWNPDLETFIIKATSHNEQCVDYKSIERVFQWLRTSPLYLKSLLYILSRRMEKTRSWVVALKGLMLIHGVFCFDLPNVQKMGRLPFDLSHFSDGYLSHQKAWSFNVFVRAYYAHLDQKSAYVCSEAKKQSKQGKKTEETLMEELQRLEKLQGLIDTLLQIKPRQQHMNVVLVLEAMDCIIDEALEVYDTFCKEIDRVLLRIYDMGGKMEARIGLNIVEKADVQCDRLLSFLDFCRDIGVLNISDYPKIVRIPEKDIHELRRIINEVSEKKSMEDNNGVVVNEDKPIVARDCSATVSISQQKESEKGLMAVITDQWEVFDDDIMVDVKENTSYGSNAIFSTNPFVDSYSIVPYVPVYNNVLPDLISL